MKLWVDDIRSAPDDSWHVARTSLEAIRAIARYDFEVISLDHDISHYENLDESDVDQNVYACNETFASVAYYIVAVYGYAPGVELPKVILHTSNQVAGDEMYQVLTAGFTGVVEKKYTGSTK